MGIIISIKILIGKQTVKRLKKKFKKVIKEENLKNTGYYKENETPTMKDTENILMN